MIALPRRALLGALATAPIAAPFTAWAQEAWPTRSVRIVVPYGPGSTDILARMVAEPLTQAFGKPFVVENRPGGGGITGTTLVAQATDGHTLLMATNGTHGINSGLHPSLSYDAVRDFTPIIKVASVPLVLIVRPDIPVHSVAELVALAKAQPDGLNFGSAGIGASGHIAGEMFKRQTGTEFVHVPYAGDGRALTDMIGGRLTFMFANLPATMAFIRQNQVRAIGVTGDSRAPALPDVPTMKEAGLADFRIDPWYGLIAPAGMPGPVANRINEVVSIFLAQPVAKERLAGLGAEFRPESAQAFATGIREDITRYTDTIRAANITLS
ncbi:tripartite tricarboxylate transporter substrate binding protein [Rhodovarius crocodyli]|uniref:Tripartite tricarboxylate transporter substrate binding protein n=1 Tax=Rhodovarius crocodyli TaxID=1979269 RepID=A0A437MGD8_9PROT|nr:tripartite tricarboxylate transporter substrate-binding protein [Rhodovarius crocodyli]RVT96714.1 tripartite tricarboxylate transporter substrate binding protein [Rhodovarius crocodyli]